MATIAWGEPTVEWCKLVADEVPANAVWAPFKHIKDKTAVLTPTKGTKQQAKTEGGKTLDSMYDANEYSFALELYQANGEEKPFVDVNGVIDDHYAIRLTPKDRKLPGFIMEKCAVQVGDKYSSSDGKTWEYTFEGLTPKDGTAILKEYTAPTT